VAKWSLLKQFVSRVNAALVFGVNALTRLRADPEGTPSLHSITMVNW
jgi:hypothetical protein